MPRISNKIDNRNADAGALDDVEVIGGYKVVQTKAELTALKETETIDEKHILTNGCAVYVVAEKKTYRWNESNNDFDAPEAGDMNLAVVATTGDFNDLQNIPKSVVTADGVLTTSATLEVNGVTREEFDAEIEELREEIANIDVGDVDLSEYAKQSDIDSFKNAFQDLVSGVVEDSYNFKIANVFTYEGIVKDTPGETLKTILLEMLEYHYRTHTSSHDRMDALANLYIGLNGKVYDLDNAQTLLSSRVYLLENADHSGVPILNADGVLCF